MMAEFIYWHLLPIWFGIACWELGKAVYRRYHVFRWKCKQCGFKIKTSSLETYNISRSSHNHSSTREYK